MNTEKIFITGCGGMLGNAIYPYFVSRYKKVLATDKVVNEEWLDQLDVRDDTHLSRIFKEYRPDLILHLAAETNLEYCETHPDISEHTNSRATKTIAQLSEEYGATLIYISTAGVFDGLKKGFYTEEDKPNPIMVYGKTKYEGELQAIQHCSRTFVVRAGWMMGGGRSKEKKFIYKILRQIVQGKKEIFAVNDRWGTPTYTHDFAMNLFKLMDMRKYGTYHMACEGKGTRYDVAGEILDICNRPDIRLNPVSSDFFKEEYFAPRPQSEMMYNAKLRKIGIHRMRPWKKSLRDYIFNYFYDYIQNAVSDKTERRKHFRSNGYTPLAFTVKDKLIDVLHTCTCTDKSVSGIGLITETELQPGQIIVKHPIKKPSSADTVPGQHTQKINGKYRIGLEALYNNHFVVTNISRLNDEQLLRINKSKK